jgi:hypothetical protein
MWYNQEPRLVSLIAPCSHSCSHGQAGLFVPSRLAVHQVSTHVETQKITQRHPRPVQARLPLSSMRLRQQGQNLIDTIVIRQSVCNWLVDVVCVHHEDACDATDAIYTSALPIHTSLEHAGQLCQMHHAGGP